MPTADLRRVCRLALAVAFTIGATIGATREWIRDRQNSKYVRDQLAARSIKTGV